MRCINFCSIGVYFNACEYKKLFNFVVCGNGSIKVMRRWYFLWVSFVHYLEPGEPFSKIIPFKDYIPMVVVDQHIFSLNYNSEL